MSETLKNNLSEVKALIESARSRSPFHQEVKLVAVSKTVDADMVKDCFELGQLDFGENKPQELKSKYEILSGLELKWHQIGTLQRNKVKYIIDKVCMIHSLDSLPLAQMIDKKAKEAGRVVDCLLQVNISEEENKHGIETKSAEEFVKQLQELDNIRLKGLMGMAPFEEDSENARPYFKNLRRLLDDINSKKIYKTDLTELSMGMSGDFEVAIEEGATIVRVGTRIFGQRNYNL